MGEGEGGAWLWSRSGAQTVSVREATALAPLVMLAGTAWQGGPPVEALPAWTRGAGRIRSRPGPAGPHSAGMPP